jgi:tripeptidyl-peptidase-2
MLFMGKDMLINHSFKRLITTPLVMDANNQVLAVQDTHTKNITITSPGDYTIQLQMCHTDVQLLKQLSDFVLFLDKDIPKGKEVSVPLHQSFIEAVNHYKGPNTLKSFTLAYGNLKPIFTSAVKDVPKDAKPGDLLIGEFTLKSKKQDGSWLKASFIVPPKASEASTTVSNDENKEDEEAKYKEAIRDLRVSWISKIKDKTIQEKTIASLLQEFPEHVPLLAKVLEIKSEQSEQGADEILGLCEQIFKLIDGQQVAAFFGVSQETPTEAAKKVQKEYQKKRKILSLVHQQKCNTLAKQLKQSSTDVLRTEYEKSWSLYKQWVKSIGSCEKVDFGYLVAYVEREKMAQRYGNALKAVISFLDNVGGGFNSPEESDVSFRQAKTSEVKKAWEMKEDLLKALGWGFWEEYESRWRYLRLPQVAALF